MDANLTDEAKAAWKAFADRHGVTMSGVLEVLANELRGLVDVEKLPAMWRQIVADARAHDAEQRSRAQPD